MGKRYCVRKMDLFALTTPKVADNLSISEADKLQKELQSKIIKETGSEIPIFFVSPI